MAVYKIEKSLSPPILYIGTIKWLRENLFSNVFNSSLTILSLLFIFSIVPFLLNWVILDANFSATSALECRENSTGACWAFIVEKINLFIYGLYPNEQYWRPNTVFISLFVIFFIIKSIKDVKFKRKLILISFFVYPFFAFYILYGGFILPVVDADKWGGLLLTLVIATTGIVFSFPIGLVLALGRNSKMPVIKYLSIIYIEFIRGVPLISILFMASVVLPLFFSANIDIDKLLRALIGITLFQAAYIAEIVRGGLQAIPRGQYEAADAIGLNFSQKMLFIVLPQALKVSIPNLTGSFISLFKDTTLVLIIGLFDMLSIVKLGVSDSNWLGMEIEGYVFVTIVFWIILYTMSKYADKIENRLKTDN